MCLIHLCGSSLISTEYSTPERINEHPQIIMNDADINGSGELTEAWIPEN